MSSSFFISPITKSLSKYVKKLRLFDRIYQMIYTKECNEFGNKNGICILKALPFNSFNFVKVSNVSRCFRFDIPNNYSSRLMNYNFYSNDKESINNDSEFNFEVIRSFIDNNYPSIKGKSLELINQYIEKTAEYFFNELILGKSKSNNTILGVYSIKSKHNKKIELEMFITDYFTYNCIVSIFKYLYRIDSKPFTINSINDIKKIFPFVCCCGIGGFINLQYKGLPNRFSTKSKMFSHSISGTLVTKRSNAAACSNHWHASFDETFDIRDKENNNPGEKPSLHMCLSRGLYEELGMHYTPQKHFLKNMILFIIINDNRIEAEFFTEIDVAIDSHNDLKNFINQYQCASDAENENSHLLLIETEKTSTFFKNKINNGEKVTPEALYFSEIYNKLGSNKLLNIFYKLNQLSL